ncbi:Histidine phosphatase superfamily (branch 1) [Roseovarius tolerans]|uniref:Histidine phosphatase superfamily (Branch 1) n=1 Tax=Roseovarius tolerans TaxID=74031 RepID=A0A0L6CS66_9RHOB|nr:histidine phosphatase family protein [Roseovarius tolerans]KNX40609.1 Histidine phosphatase superfamily (branch 1) [Roseovarius tolerans]
MKNLILMRHAKSDWGSPLLHDHTRPLNERGRRSAMALGDWLRAQDLIPDQILCSSSARTQETCARLKLPLAPDLHDVLYLAEVPDMLRVLRGATGARVLMLGHNPGIAEFAASLVTAPPAHERFDDYPTGATLVVRFEIDHWADLRPGTGAAQQFVIPREMI